MPDLETAWFVLIAVLLTGYATLDGFDLGVGMLHLFVARDDRERRTLLNAVGPVWDGNEVWLLAGGGALFAAFPKAYATLFSGLYVPLMLVLLGLILRAVSIEFRSQVDGPVWRRSWDRAFAVGSFLPTLLFGVALGNVLFGLPISEDGELAAGFFGLLHPFPLVVGLLAVALFLMHGSAWLLLKTEGPVADRARRVALYAWIAVLAAWVSALSLSHGASFWKGFHTPAAWILPVALHLGLLAFPVSLRRAAVPPFAVSSFAILALGGVVATGLYPDLIPALGDASRSLTIRNAASSPLTLRTMLVIALTGVPVVLAYTAFIYRTFRGPVVLDESSY